MSAAMSNPHTYGLAEWQNAQLARMTEAQLRAEHAATTVDDYRDKVSAVMRRRGLPVPEKSKPKRKASAKK